MRPIRTAKAAAERVDPIYVRRPRRGLRAMIVSALAVTLVAAFWWFEHQSRGDAAIYSPGHVTTVHAALDANCAQCHESDGHGGFRQAVSDQACLKCHAAEATAHNPHQSTFVAQIGTAGSGHALRSSDCTACHIEHRGQDMMLARSDNTCLSCHKDVTKFTAGPPRIQPNVTRFGTGSHPQFGRTLLVSLPGDNGPVKRDPTPLNFSHEKHMKIAAPAGQSENCTACHEPPPAFAAGIGIQPDRRYMQPVSYQKHCASCHALEVVAGSGTPVPHIRLDDIRPLLQAYADREGYFRRVLAAMPEDQRQAALVEKKETVGPPPLRKKTVTTIQRTPDDWAAAQARPFWAAIRGWYTDENNHVKGLEEVRAAIQREQEKADKANEGKPASAQAEPDVPAELRSSKAIEFYMTHARNDNDNKCGLCHRLNDDPAALSQLQQLVRPDTNPAAPGELPATAPAASQLDTLPTGIGSSPRRWFTNSVFDHGAHRGVSCLACHTAAPSSKQMSDVLLPGIESCVSCHHDPDATGPGAGDSCLSCHPFYHDRTRGAAHPTMPPVQTSGVGGVSRHRPLLVSPPDLRVGDESRLTLLMQ